jgi:hypothetical protein
MVLIAPEVLGLFRRYTHTHLQATRTGISVNNKKCQNNKKCKFEASKSAT